MNFLFTTIFGLDSSVNCTVLATQDTDGPRKTSTCTTSLSPAHQPETLLARITTQELGPETEEHLRLEDRHSEQATASTHSAAGSTMDERRSCRGNSWTCSDATLSNSDHDRQHNDHANRYRPKREDTPRVSNTQKVQNEHDNGETCLILQTSHTETVTTWTHIDFEAPVFATIEEPLQRSTGSPARNQQLKREKETWIQIGQGTRSPQDAWNPGRYEKETAPPKTRARRTHPGPKGDDGTSL